MIKKLKNVERFIVNPKRLENLKGGDWSFKYRGGGDCRGCYRDDDDG